jgi:hypothetical protein
MHKSERLFHHSTTYPILAESVHFLRTWLKFLWPDWEDATSSGASSVRATGIFRRHSVDACILEENLVVAVAAGSEDSGSAAARTRLKTGNGQSSIRARNVADQIRMEA